MNVDEMQVGIETIVGIDLGTTNSVIGISVNGKCRFFDDPDTNSPIIPSIVSYRPDNTLICGSRATSDENIRYSISSIKRWMGKEYTDKNNKSPIEISSEILKYLKKLAEESLKHEVHKAIITVPAYFNESARQATKAAARIAGLEVVRLLNEPTAAALAYGSGNESEGVFAIYDLGGGTFDISILKMHRGVFQVMAVGGDTGMGGDDLDRSILSFISDKYKIQLPSEDRELKTAILDVRAIKESLSSTSEVTRNLLGKNIAVSVGEFNSVIKSFVDKTSGIFLQTVKDSGYKIDEINEIILVGGSTRIPYIKQRIKDLVGKDPLDSIDPDLSVAVGAATQAENLFKNSSGLLLDVTPLSLGIELIDGIVDKIIHRNTPIPIIKTQKFTTQKDGQTAFLIHVVQGEGERVSECRSLTRFELKGIPAMPAGKAVLEIEFQIDADGLLIVRAKELSIGIIKEIEVKPSYGLTENEILSLIEKANKANKGIE
jgi:molecular chaperone HscA